MEPLSKMKSEPVCTIKSFERTVIIEFSSKSTMVITIPEILQSYHTSSWLMDRCLSKFPQKSSSSGKKFVALRVKGKSSVHIDYLLSLPDTRLSFLPEKITLVPYYTSPLPREASVSLANFEIISFIGDGGFGNVYLVRSKIDGQFYAMKQLRKSDSAKTSYRKIYRERNIMAQIKSPHIVKLSYAFQTAEFCYFVMDYVPSGNLLSLKTKVNQLREHEARFYIANILLALRDLHSLSIIYRDLKTENIILDMNGHIKLCDFGLAKELDQASSLNGSICGTPQFLSPEMVNGKAYDFKTDYYAVGVVAYELMVGKLPFNDKEKTALFKKISETQPTIPRDLSEPAKDFILKLLCKDPQQRLGAKDGIKEILSHAWFKGLNIEKIDARNGRVPFIREPGTKNLKRLSSLVNIEKWADNMASSPEKTENTATTEQWLKTFSFRASKDYVLDDDDDVDYESLSLRGTRPQPFNYNANIDELAKSNDLLDDFKKHSSVR